MPYRLYGEKGLLMNKRNLPKMNLTLAEMYVNNWEKYKKLFSKKALNSSIKKRYEYEFISNEYVPIDDIYKINYYNKKGYPQLLSKPVTWRFEEWKGEWMRHIDKLAYDFRIPSHYQIGGAHFLRDCLIYDFPYLKNYNFDCYSFNYDGIEEIYISCNEPKVSIYCPIEALVKKDPDIIKRRIESYWKSYYCAKDRKPMLDEQLSVLDSDYYKKLCKDIIGE